MCSVTNTFQWHISCCHCVTEAVGSYLRFICKFLSLQQQFENVIQHGGFQWEGWIYQFDKYCRRERVCHTFCQSGDGFEPEVGKQARSLSGGCPPPTLGAGRYWSHHCKHALQRYKYTRLSSCLKKLWFFILEEGPKKVYRPYRVIVNFNWKCE